ncbi:hypothetical protein CRENBAI_023924 [Crenichthys baileyi]|uniref:Uncharacterized protein n=1 Tax=Crenichthys baileyi TaxID=28760 RepID=A0AAV9R2X9_9TELE
MTTYPWQLVPSPFLISGGTWGYATPTPWSCSASLSVGEGVEEGHLSFLVFQGPRWPPDWKSQRVLCSAESASCSSVNQVTAPGRNSCGSTSDVTIPLRSYCCSRDSPWVRRRRPPGPLPLSPAEQSASWTPSSALSLSNTPLCLVILCPDLVLVRHTPGFLPGM